MESYTQVIYPSTRKQKTKEYEFQTTYISKIISYHMLTHLLLKYQKINVSILTLFHVKLDVFYSHLHYVSDFNS